MWDESQYVSGLGLSLKSIQIDEEFRIDRPFIYNIKFDQNETTPDILSLFSGYVVNPN